MSTTQRAAPRRERARAATIGEIKQTAVALMHEQGTVDVRFTDIARAMDMTPPALYRYFADRNELISALIADAYDDLGRCLAEGRAAIPGDDVGAGFLALCQEYRSWARREPQQFTLILGLPVPGYVAPKAGPTTEAAGRALTQLSELFVDALRRGQLAAAAGARRAPRHRGLRPHQDRRARPCPSRRRPFRRYCTPGRRCTASSRSKRTGISSG